MVKYKWLSPVGLLGTKQVCLHEISDILLIIRRYYPKVCTNSAKRTAEDKGSKVPISNSISVFGHEKVSTTKKV